MVGGGEGMVPPIPTPIYGYKIVILIVGLDFISA